MFRTRHKNSRRIGLAMLGAVSAMALSGCSTAPGSVYDFTQINGMEPAQQITVQIPQALKDAAGADAENLLVTSVVVKSLDLDSSKYCAISIEITYPDGAADKLTTPTLTKAQADAAAEDDVQTFLDQYEATSPADLEQKLTRQVQLDTEASLKSMNSDMTVEEYLASYDDFDSVQEAALERWIRDDTAGYLGYLDELPSSIEEGAEKVISGMEQSYGAEAEEAAKVSNVERVASRLHLSSARAAAALNVSAPEQGAYLSVDFQSATRVQDCAKSPTDPDATSSFDFPIQSERGIDTFATVGLTVMKNGEISIFSGEVNGYMVDTNRDWIVEK